MWINLYQQAFSSAIAWETVVELTSNLAYPCIIILLFFFFFTMDLESTPIYKYSAPTSASLQLKESSKPILPPDYELRLCLINMVQD